MPGIVFYVHSLSIIKILGQDNKHHTSCISTDMSFIPMRWLADSTLPWSECSLGGRLWSLRVQLRECEQFHSELDALNGSKVGVSWTWNWRGTFVAMWGGAAKNSKQSSCAFSSMYFLSQQVNAAGLIDINKHLLNLVCVYVCHYFTTINYICW